MRKFLRGIVLPAAIIGMITVIPGSSAIITEEIQGTPGLADREIFERIGGALQTTSLADIRAVTLVTGEGERGSHLLLRFASAHPVPLVYTFPRAARYAYETDPDLVLAVLPAGADREVFLSLMESPSWSNRRTDGVILMVYGREGAMPRIIDAHIEERATLLERARAGLRQLLVPEQLRIASMNIMRGYRIYGVSFSLLLGLSFLIALAFLLVLSRKQRIERAALLALAFLLIYQARATMDFVRATVVDAREWITQGTNKEHGDLHLAIREIQAIEQSAPGTVGIATCGGFERPLQYFLSPISVGSDERTWNDASHAILAPGWSIGNGTILCDERRRTGEVLQVFPGGSAIAALTQ